MPKPILAERWISGISEKKLAALDVLVKQEEKDKESSKRGAFLYRFDQERYSDSLDRFAVRR